MSEEAGGPWDVELQTATSGTKSALYFELNFREGSRKTSGYGVRAAGRAAEVYCSIPDRCRLGTQSPLTVSHHLPTAAIKW